MAFGVCLRLIFNLTVVAFRSISIIVERLIFLKGVLFYLRMEKLFLIHSHFTIGSQVAFWFWSLAWLMHFFIWPHLIIIQFNSNFLIRILNLKIIYNLIILYYLIRFPISIYHFFRQHADNRAYLTNLRHF